MRLLILLTFCATLSGQTFSGAVAEDEQINKAVRDGLIPGAVLVIGHQGQVVYRKAYGERALVPSREPMTVDTIFDAASLTKVIATTSSIMKLFEQGQIRIDDPVTKYLPEFQDGKSTITIRHLMTHFSGLRPDLDLRPVWSGYETGIHRALIDKPVRGPGIRFVYSDINFVLLGEIVRRLSGKSLAEYARENIFEPVGMSESMFQPPASLRPRIAPTELDPDTGKPLRGVVHDETSRFMGGIAGHAGLFTTADDLAKFAQMMIDHGVAANGTRIFSALTVEKFTTPQTPASQPILRGLGWDIDSPFSSNRGDLFPIGSYGHTGFTGTSVWIDPFSRTYVILLTNSVHPHRGKSLVSLRSRVATIAAASFGILAPAVAITGYNETLIGAGLHREIDPKGPVYTGLDVLARDNFAPLRGKRIGLITNHTGIARDGRRNVDLMVAAGIKVAALYSPEHGILGVQDKSNVLDAKDTVTGIRVHSLYEGPNRRLTPEAVKGIDELVFDIQDAGARFYTYSCTMLYAIEEAAKLHLPLYILDRPNPVTGTHVEGPLLTEPSLESFVGCMDIPLRHGMTFGELAKFANSERNLGADLRVIPMEGWNRGDWFDATGLIWVDPSPNMRSLNAATLYAGIGMIEYSKNYSVGRGTDAPFEQVGADWIRGPELAAYLNNRFIPGVRAYATRFRPTASNFAGQTIEGVRFVVTDRDAFDSTGFGIEVGFALEKLYPGKISWNANKTLIGNSGIIRSAQSGVDPRTVIQEMNEAIAEWDKIREKYLLYKVNN